MMRKTRRPILLALLAAAFAALLPATAHAGEAPPFMTLKTGTLKVCLYAGFAPFASKDDKGNWQGWDVDYLTEFAQENSLAFEVVPRDFKDIWTEPGKGSCDIAGTGISDTRERRAAAGPAAAWSNTYYHVLRTFLVRTADFTNPSLHLRGRLWERPGAGLQLPELAREGLPALAAEGSRPRHGLAALQHDEERRGRGALLLRGAQR